MLHLLHTLYITEPDVSLRLDGQALRVTHADGRKDHIPLHLLEQIVTFSYGTVTQHVMDACAERGIGLSFHTQNGRFRFRIQGEVRGNVHLRQRQYALPEEERFYMAASVLKGKLRNSRVLLSRHRRNHPTTGAGRLQAAENTLSQIEASLDTLQSKEALRSAEGQAARVYFSVFQDLILSDDRAFHFQGRNRRPPKDPCNAMLSFAYTLLTNDCIQALESAGLDPYVGYFHGTRSGKPSLALDLVEEFRPVMADRTVLHLINLKMLTSDLFAATDDGGIYLNDTGRAVFLREWNQMKHREIQIGCTDQPVPMGLMPYLQAQQLSRYLRGEQANFTTIDRR